jgi:hypothetical protein
VLLILIVWGAHGNIFEIYEHVEGLKLQVLEKCACNGREGSGRPSSKRLCMQRRKLCILLFIATLRDIGCEPVNTESPNAGSWHVAHRHTAAHEVWHEVA